MRIIGREINWFQEILQKEFRVTIKVHKTSAEATELGLDEVEDFFVPTEVFLELPESLLYELMIYDDEMSNEWVGAIAFYPDTPEWCLQVITKNGELVFRKTLPLPKEKS
ncbi:hypothetical protein [Sporosarcina sp. P33]|uniref:hypothetical protein n=1 Tax=Sporosarcina sp. P33 TaxID=1930764 RepID=UPI0009BF2103|nr:hypothetical protein [Sporosarcina sp. P33]ARD48833.1 hypothetical protein SporoP33_11765 [Sporosarcina sp. P33]